MVAYIVLFNFVVCWEQRCYLLGNARKPGTAYIASPCDYWQDNIKLLDSTHITWSHSNNVM